MHVGKTEKKRSLGRPRHRAEGNIKTVTYKILMAVKMTVMFFWVAWPWGITGRHQIFKKHTASIYGAKDGDVALRIEKVCFSEMLASINKST
jgi:hypothetical protein